MVLAAITCATSACGNTAVTLPVNDVVELQVGSQLDVTVLENDYPSGTLSLTEVTSQHPDRVRATRAGDEVNVVADQQGVAVITYTVDGPGGPSSAELTVHVHNPAATTSPSPSPSASPSVMPSATATVAPTVPPQPSPVPTTEPTATLVATPPTPTVPPAAPTATPTSTPPPTPTSTVAPTPTITLVPVAPASFTVSAIEFGQIEVGSSASLSLFVRNVGESVGSTSIELVTDLTVVGPTFSQDRTSCDAVAPLESCEVIVTFAPQTAGIASAGISLNGDSPVPSIVTGTGVVPLVLPSSTSPAVTCSRGDQTCDGYLELRLPEPVTSLLLTAPSGHCSAIEYRVRPLGSAATSFRPSATTPTTSTGVLSPGSQATVTFAESSAASIFRIDAYGVVDGCNTGTLLSWRTIVTSVGADAASWAVGPIVR